MNTRQRIADWITGGELTFHQEAAVKALAEAQRADAALRRVGVMLPTISEENSDNQFDFQRMTRRIELILQGHKGKDYSVSVPIAEKRALDILREALK